jgi:amyloid beta precursor protein binding protein 1
LFLDFKNNCDHFSKIKMTSGPQAGKPQNSPSGDTGNESGPMVPVIDLQRRYDRGIRVWGAHGQEAVEKARICLLNTGPTGAESLKNLVLGGIHSFTIVDGQKVEATDVGNNYLITASALGGSRAQCVTECLKELNETVKGSYVEEHPATLVSTNPDFFNTFDLVIATQLSETTAIALDALCRERGVALVLARSYGLVGYLRVSYN